MVDGGAGTGCSATTPTAWRLIDSFDDGWMDGWMDGWLDVAGVATV